MGRNCYWLVLALIHRFIHPRMVQARLTNCHRVHLDIHPSKQVRLLKSWKYYNVQIQHQFSLIQTEFPCYLLSLFLFTGLGFQKSNQRFCAGLERKKLHCISVFLLTSILVVQSYIRQQWTGKITALLSLAWFVWRCQTCKSNHLQLPGTAIDLHWSVSLYKYEIIIAWKVWCGCKCTNYSTLHLTWVDHRDAGMCGCNGTPASAPGTCYVHH